MFQSHVFFYFNILKVRCVKIGYIEIKFDFNKKGLENDAPDIRINNAQKKQLKPNYEQY